MYNWLKGGTRERICLLGSGGLGNLFLKGFRQATLQELSACPELLIILRVFRGLAAAFVKNGNHRRHPPSIFLLAQRGQLGACERENTSISGGVDTMLNINVV